jgi:electron transport complex protein RnfB
MAPKARAAVAVIDEEWCIGCTLCIKACPTDAIVGSNKRMHTVIEAVCTGCDCAFPVCPVDCINAGQCDGPSGPGWAAWSEDWRMRPHPLRAPHGARGSKRSVQACSARAAGRRACQARAQSPDLPAAFNAH